MSQRNETEAHMIEFHETIPKSLRPAYFALRYRQVTARRQRGKKNSEWLKDLFRIISEDMRRGRR